MYFVVGKTREVAGNYLTVRKIFLRKVFRISFFFTVTLAISRDGTQERKREREEKLLLNCR